MHVQWGCIDLLSPTWAWRAPYAWNEWECALSEPPPDVVVRVVNGNDCRSARKLFQAFAKDLEFPSYFGFNWDALDECVADLEWLPANGYMIILSHAMEILPNNERDFRFLVEALKHAAEDFRSPATDSVTERPKGFCVVWHCLLEEEVELQERLFNVGVSSSRLPVAE